MSAFKPQQRASTRILVERLRELAASGFTMKQAADEIGIKYQSVGIHARSHGIKFRPPKIGSYRADRNAEIARRYLAGEIQAELEREYGITRERVRQICDVHNCVEARKRHVDFVATVVGTITRKNLTASEAMQMFGISRMSVYLYCKQHGVKPARMTAEDETEIDALVAEASTKSSVWQASCHDKSLAQKICREMKRRGLKSKGRSRWDDFSHRKTLLPEWRSQGFTWKECADKIAQYDGKPIGVAALTIWVKRHMPELINKRISNSSGVIAASSASMTPANGEAA